MPEILDDVGHSVDAVLRRAGSGVVLALPLGIGKPNPWCTSSNRPARRDPGLGLSIFTALSLLKPVAGSALERAPPGAGARCNRRGDRRGLPRSGAP